VKGDYYIVDRLFDRAELRIGTEDSVTIYSEEYRDGLTVFEKIFY
jgi:hypothetical protein